MRLVVLPLLGLVLLLAACGGDPAPSATSAPSVAVGPTETAVLAPTSRPTPTPPPTRRIVHTAPVATLTPTPTQEAPSSSSGFRSVAELPILLGDDTVWGDLFDTLAEHEQSCIRESLGTGRLQLVMNRSIFGIVEDDLTDDWEISIFDCLDPETGRAVLLFSLLADFDAGTVPDRDEMDCLTGVAANTDAAAVVRAMGPGTETVADALPAGEFMASFFHCIPEYLTRDIVGDTEYMSEDGVQCLLEVVLTLDAEMMAMFFVLDEDDWEANSRFDEFFSAMVDCTFGISGGTPGPDDHANDMEGATPVTAGEAVVGAIDYDGDWDTFLLTATEGEAYQIDVELGTLGDSNLFLMNEYGEEVFYNDDYRQGGLDSRLVWQAPKTGEYYIEVAGYGLGIYSLVVQVVELDPDDHSNVPGGATPLQVGDELAGQLEYEGDVDVFRFDAVAGTIYKIAAKTRTLGDSILELYDADWVIVGYSDDNQLWIADGVLSWLASESGVYYVQVYRGYDTGSYVLTADTVEDDHKDSSEEATALEIGEYIKARLDHVGDRDYFVFQARATASYLIDVEPDTYVDTTVELLDRRGQVAYNDDYGDGLGSRLEWTAPESGPYWIAVAGLSGPGTYALTVKEVATAPSDALMGDLVVNASTTGKGLIDRLSWDEASCLEERIGGSAYEAFRSAALAASGRDAANVRALYDCLTEGDFLIYGVGVSQVWAGGWTTETQACSIALARQHPEFVYIRVGLEEAVPTAHEADTYLLDFYDCLNDEEKITLTLRTFSAPEEAGVPALVGLLEFIPESEASCIFDMVGVAPEQFPQRMQADADGGFMSEFLSAAGECISEETSVNFFVSGTAEVLGGLSPQSQSCLRDFGLEHYHFLELISGGEATARAMPAAEAAEIADDGFRMVQCFNDDELLALQRLMAEVLRQS